MNFKGEGDRKLDMLINPLLESFRLRSRHEINFAVLTNWRYLLIQRVFWKSTQNPQRVPKWDVFHNRMISCNKLVLHILYRTLILENRKCIGGRNVITKKRCFRTKYFVLSFLLHLESFFYEHKCVIYGHHVIQFFSKCLNLMLKQKNCASTDLRETEFTQSSCLQCMSVSDYCNHEEYHVSMKNKIVYLWVFFKLSTLSSVINHHLW